ncbi:MAG: type II secretion system GspH family protein, partial [Campylobacteraceae bacterium]|nr:type II secretion system GspH family protein [Campylobacteraceae bacterium]
MRRSAFTMIELIFVIVILGVLAAVAVPRLGASREDANIAKYKSDISAIRSSIVTTRSQQLMSGNASYPNTEGSNSPSILFGGVLDYGIKPSSATKTGWRKGADNATGNITGYVLRLENTDIVFSYNRTSGVFDCLNQNTG